MWDCGFLWNNSFGPTWRRYHHLYMVTKLHNKTTKFHDQFIWLSLQRSGCIEKSILFIFSSIFEYMTLILMISTDVVKRSETLTLKQIRRSTTTRILWTAYVNLLACYVCDNDFRITEQLKSQGKTNYKCAPMQYYVFFLNIIALISMHIMLLVTVIEN